MDGPDRGARPKAGDDVLLRPIVTEVGELDALVLVDVSLRFPIVGAGTRFRVPLASIIPSAAQRRADILNALTKSQRFQQ
jgi:hypothetical protein